MPSTRSPLSYDDAQDILDRALSAEKGIRIRLTTHGAAMGLRARLNTFRALDRSRNLKVYDKDHPLCGNSVYDALVIAIPPHPELGKGHGMVIEIKKRSGEMFDVEEMK